MQKVVSLQTPIHMSNSHTEFSWILSNGLGEDSVTNGRTDGDDCNIPIAFKKNARKAKNVKKFVTDEGLE